MQNRQLFVIVFLFLYNVKQTAYSQNDSTHRPDIARFVDGVFHNTTSPVRWKARDWTKAGVVIIGTALVSAIDNPMRGWATSTQNETLDIANDVGYWYGKPQSAMAFTGGFYLTGIVTKNEWARETGLMLGTALATSGLMEAILKPLIGRTRPIVESGNYNFHPFSSDSRFHSLPSGHAIIAYTISFVLARRVNNKPLKVFFYSLAASTAFCRLYSDAHWTSDVLLGGTIAWFSASESVRYISKNKLSKQRSKTSICLNPGIASLSLTIKFNQ